jgi:hypothetical protein
MAESAACYTDVSNVMTGSRSMVTSEGGGGDEKDEVGSKEGPICVFIVI